MTNPPSLTDGLFAKDYRVVRVLFEGKATTTYVAEQLSTGALRALEILHPPEPLDDAAAARFLRDTAPITPYFESPYVARTLDRGIEAGEPWLATELLTGEPLDAWIERLGPAPPGAAIEILLDVGRALEAARRVGVVHGYLTPRSILVPTLEPGDGNLRVLGFGVARLLRSWDESADLTVNAAWRAPEQIDGARDADSSADVWAIGLLAFYLLTGRSYWKGAGHLALLTALVMEPIVPASERARELGVLGWPNELDGWFDTCVCRDLEARFPDPATALLELAEVAHELGLVRPAPRVKGSSYDDELESESEDPAHPDGAAGGEVPYRKWARPPKKEPIGRDFRVKEPPKLMMGNPKGSFYDGGLQEPRRARRWVVPLLLFAAAALAVLRFLVFRR